jgi:hypothetical protein
MSHLSPKAPTPLGRITRARPKERRRRRYPHRPPAAGRRPSRPPPPATRRHRIPAPPRSPCAAFSPLQHFPLISVLCPQVQDLLPSSGGGRTSTPSSGIRRISAARRPYLFPELRRPASSSLHAYPVAPLRNAHSGSQAEMPEVAVVSDATPC